MLLGIRHGRESSTGELIFAGEGSSLGRERSEGVALLGKPEVRASVYTQAAIVAVHAEAEWRCDRLAQIVALYDRLLRIHPSAVVQLNRAVAIAMRDGQRPVYADRRGVGTWELANYYLAISARADMCRRLGRTAEARSSYEKALGADPTGTERQFLQERIRH